MANKMPMDDDDDIQMSTNNTTTNDNVNDIIDNNPNPNTNPSDNNDNSNTNNNDNNNDDNNKTDPKSQNTDLDIDKNTSNTSKSIVDDEEKKNNNNNNNSTSSINPLMLVQSALSEFVNEMSAADIKATSLYSNHFDRQQKLMNQFIADSLRLMHDFNTKLTPIRSVLNKLKSPLQDVLLNQFISIPCDELDLLTKKQRNNLYTPSYQKTWGTTPLSYKYNKNDKKSNPHLQFMDLGAELISLQTTIKIDNNNNNNNNTDNDNDASMNDKTKTTTSTVASADDLYTQAIYGYLSNFDNITASQTELVLKFFNTARSEKKRIEMRRQQKLKKIERKQAQKAQRDAGVAMLISVLPWMTSDQANVVMEMKQDIIEQATNYCMSTDPADLFLAINQWKKSHPPPKINKNNNNNDNNNSGNDDNDNLNDWNDGNDDYPMYTSSSTTAVAAGRSSIDKRCLNWSQSSGDTKSVIFRCNSITDDGEISLIGVLDRNFIPLNPSDAKILKITVNDLISCRNMRIVSQEIVHNHIKNNVLEIVFQVVKEKPPQLDLQSILQNIQIPDAILATNDIEKMKEYALQYAQQQQMYGSGMGGMGGMGGFKNKYGNRDKTEFIPISFKPKCRDLEYKLDFEDKDIPSAACLKSVSHHIDGSVLFNGILDDGSGLIGTQLNQAIEIYSQIIDDVTHNIICIIFDNELRQDIVIDVKNLSFTELTLKNVIDDSVNDFIKKDAAGNKISYRIIVKDKKIIGVLTKFGDKIKEIPFIEHNIPPCGTLVSVTSRDMLGIVKCIPTGLIITNNPNTNVPKIATKYNKNVNSKITRKHWAQVNGYVDIDIIREGINGWRQLDNPLCQSFAVSDILPANDNDINEYITYKQKNQTNLMDEITNLMKNVENDFNNIKKNKLDSNNKKLLTNCTNTVKNIQELTSNLKNRKSKLNNDETKFIELVNNNITKYNREIRTLGFEVRMSSMNVVAKK